jgi:hypothetical protein
MLSMLLMDAFMLFIPLSIGVAELRARLFDIARGASPARHRGFYPCDSSLVRPLEAAHPSVHRQALLPQEV